MWIGVVFRFFESFVFEVPNCFQMQSLSFVFWVKNYFGSKDSNQEIEVLQTYVTALCISCNKFNVLNEFNKIFHNYMADVNVLN